MDSSHPGPRRTSSVEPWTRLSDLLEKGDQEALKSFLASLPPQEIARALSRSHEANVKQTLALLGPEGAADVLELLSAVQASDIIEELPVSQAAEILHELPSDDKADLLGGLRVDDAEAILVRMDPTDAQEARELLRFEPHTAGGLMITEYLAYTEDRTVSEVIADLRRHGEHYSDYEIQYAYITNSSGLLRGVLRLRDLLLAGGSQDPIATIMIREPLSLRAEAELDEIKRVFDDKAFVGIPVTLDSGRLVGVVRRAAVEGAWADQETQTYLRLSGVMSAEEIRTMPTFVRSYRRLSWLTINIVLNVIAASVIVLYQETLASVIALAVFLPIISDMSGCSGNQAVAVSIRELALGLVKPYEYVRVLAKESSIGLINGSVLGALLGTVAALWQDNLYLGLVVGGALALNTLLAVLLGGSIPLLLKSLKLDPALASGPILTTVTDMCGFFFVLSFASAALTALTR